MDTLLKVVGSRLVLLSDDCLERVAVGNVDLAHHWFLRSRVDVSPPAHVGSLCMLQKSPRVRRQMKKKTFKKKASGVLWKLFRFPAS